MSSQPTPSGRGRGALIVFEGIDRCGKTTQSQKLAEVLKSKGANVELWRFPDRTTAMGKIINEYLANSTMQLDDGAIHLLFAANRHEKRQAMLRALASGTTLIVDRYSYSGVAYTSAKGNPMYSAEWCRGPEVGLPAADCVVYMDISPEVSAQRGGYGGERYEKAELQRAVVAQFGSLMDGRWARIDASQGIDAIHSQVVAAVEPVVERCGSGGEPLGRLWDYEAIDLAPWVPSAEVVVEVQVGSQASAKGGVAVAETAPGQAQTS